MCHMQAVHSNTRPTFKDLNAVAAHALASLLLPARLRPVSPAATAAARQSAVGPAGCTENSADSRTPPRKAASQLLQNSSGRRDCTPRMSKSLTAAQANSAAALAHVPEQLGRGVVLGDILRQVPLSCAFHAPCEAMPNTAPAQRNGTAE